MSARVGKAHVNDDTGGTSFKLRVSRLGQLFLLHACAFRLLYMLQCKSANSKGALDKVVLISS